MTWMTVLGIPAMVYVMSVTALLYCVNEQPQNPIALVGAGLLTAAIYMFHRTSIGPMQKRHRIAVCHRTQLRFVSGLLLFASVLAFAFYALLATLLVLCAVAGAFVYGRKTLTKPLRTFLYLKPLVVGTAITLFAWALNDFANSIVTLVAFILICSSDALLCDLVDRDFDAASGCPTLASQLGNNWTWIVTTALYCFASIGLLLAVEQTSVGLYFFIVFVCSLACRRLDTRYLVDFRLVLVLLLAWGEWMFWSTVLG